MNPTSQSSHARIRQIMNYSLLALGLCLFLYFGIIGYRNASNIQVVTGQPRVDTPQEILKPVAAHLEPQKTSSVPNAVHTQAVTAPSTSEKSDKPIQQEKAQNDDVNYAEVVETNSSYYSSQYSTTYEVSNVKTTNRPNRQ